MIAWGVLVLLAVALESVGILWHGPTLGSVFGAITRRRIGRWLLCGLWVWVGWHFFIRGWSFFMRAH